jgi:hypothetical protein
MTDLKALLHHGYTQGLLQPSNVESCIKESYLIHAMNGEQRYSSTYIIRLGGPTACLNISGKRKIAKMGPKPISYSL